VSTTSLVSGIVNDAQALFNHQLELFKAELKQDMEKAREGAAVMALGAGLSFVGLLVLVFALAHLLAWATDTSLWPWYAVVGGAVFAVGLALVGYVFARLKAAKPMSISATALEENVEWKTTPIRK
jgi:protein-S-isoprenylcysteine O-methyltransferase Ste14